MSGGGDRRDGLERWWEGLGIWEEDGRDEGSKNSLAREFNGKDDLRVLEPGHLGERINNIIRSRP